MSKLLGEEAAPSSWGMPGAWQEAGEGAGTLLHTFLELVLNTSSAPPSFPTSPVETGQIHLFSWR